MGLPLGAPADVLGILALRDIRRAQGLSSGRGMATAGIVMGSLGTLVFLAWVTFLAVAMLQSTRRSPHAPLATAPSPAAPLGPPAPFATAPPGGWKRIHAVELHASGGPLRAQLAAEVRSAKAAGEVLLVQTVTPSCDACREILQAMADPPLQAALAKVRLVRLDAQELPAELASMRMSELTVPWFYLIGARGEPRDAISADEWDDNEAESIAPVLDAFVHGKLSSRRVAWRGATSL
jgi:hypothetical protein